MTPVSPANETEGLSVKSDLYQETFDTAEIK